MSSAAPEHLEEQAGVAREQVDRTLEALEEKVPRHMSTLGHDVGTSQDLLPELPVTGKSKYAPHS